MIPKKAGMEPNEIPTTIFYSLVYEPPILTESVVHHPKEPNFKWWQRLTTVQLSREGSRFWKFTSQLSTNHLAVKNLHSWGNLMYTPFAPQISTNKEFVFQCSPARSWQYDTNPKSAKTRVFCAEIPLKRFHTCPLFSGEIPERFHSIHVHTFPSPPK